MEGIGLKKVVKTQGPPSLTSTQLETNTCVHSPEAQEPLPAIGGLFLRE